MTKTPILLLLSILLIAAGLFGFNPFSSDEVSPQFEARGDRSTTASTTKSKPAHAVANEPRTNERVPEREAAPVPTSVGANEDEEPERTAEQIETDEILAKLLSGRTGANGERELWRRLGELGHTDEVIAQLQQDIAADPRNSHLHTLLGSALIAKKRSQTLNSMQRREVSKQALASFNKALDLDPKNWTARFSRAMSNSSAPGFLGLQKNAIADFETLLVQQKQSPLNNDHSHTYFFLANLHSNAGNDDRAAQVRAEARQMFPADERFR